MLAGRDLEADAVECIRVRLLASARVGELDAAQLDLTAIDPALVQLDKVERHRSSSSDGSRTAGRDLAGGSVERPLAPGNRFEESREVTLLSDAERLAEAAGRVTA